MSSRRLTISSLLCDDAGSSPARTSRSPVHSPQPPLLAYASSQHSPPITIPCTDSASQDEWPPVHRGTGHRANSTTPSPCEAAPVPSSRPVSPAQRRDHISCSSVLRQMSPPSEGREANRHWRPSSAVADRDVGSAAQERRTTTAIGEFPRLGVARGAHSPRHPPYSQYLPTPPLTCSGALSSEPAAAASSTSYSRLLTSSSSSTTDVSTNSHPLLSVSPGTAVARPEPAGQLSPLMHSLHESHSIPQRPASGVSRLPQPSGLDVLVQAATEERERIGEHRRISGCEESQHSPFSISPTAQSYHSPAIRTEPRLHPSPSLSPTPPVSSQSDVALFVADQDTVNHGGKSSDERERVGKRRRPSPESALAWYHEEATAHSLYPAACTKTSEAGGLNVPSILLYHGDGERIGGLVQTSSERHASARPSSRISPTPSVSLQSLGFYSHSIPGASGSHSPVLRPVTGSTSGNLVRRSPPRSKPKPKKPGSAALSVMEKEFRDVGLSEEMGQRKEESPIATFLQMVSDDGAERNAPLQDQPRPEGIKFSALVEADASIEDFFLSAFDSPKPSERKVPSQALSTYAGDYIAPSQTSLTSQRLSRNDMSRSPLLPCEKPPTYAGNLGHSLSNLDDQTMGEADSELYEELAEAVGGASSEDERGDPDSERGETMEVDVEDELLSLVDGPVDYEAKPHQRHQTHVHRSQPSDLIDRNNFSATAPQTVARIDPVSRKKVTTKTTKKRNDAARATAKSSKPHLTKDAAPKTSKSKPGTKSKALKDVQDIPLPMIAVPSTTDKPPEDVFPIVTSSGRMVTKSRKSAAATANALLGHGISQTKKKTASLAGIEGNSSRSRSHSVIPGAPADPDTSKERSVNTEEEKTKDADEDVEDEDDKLYCICRTTYDEDKVMIACDRCDEWYHTQCVEMPDLEIDLVDQFICPNCIAQNPDLQLRTTWKQRCFSGLNHPKPNSADACHKPSRGAYSKYCSDECGVRYLHSKVQGWTITGGDVCGLWESVKDVKRREGVVVRVPGCTLPQRILAELNSDVKREAPGDKGCGAFAIGRLESQLQEVLRERETSKKDLDVIGWRERLLRLASERSENLQECGWDQRLCFGDEEWMEFGEGVLESYEYVRVNGYTEEGRNGRIPESDEQVTDGEWWCRGKKKCERHAGWQKLRSTEIQLERDSKEDALAKLTTREREIRNRIEDILHPHAQARNPVPALVLNTRFVNGNEFEDGLKKGKRKTMASA